MYSIAKEQTTCLKNEQRAWKDNFSKEDIQMVNKYMKGSQHPSSSGKCKSKAPRGIISHLLEQLSSEKQQITNVAQNVEPSHTVAM